MIYKKDLIKMVRTELGQTQKEFAKTMGLNRLRTISEYERGIDLPIDKLIRLQGVYEKQGANKQVLNIINNYVEKEISRIKGLV